MGNICPKIAGREEEDNSSPQADRSFDNYDKSNTNMSPITNRKNNSSSKERGSNNILNEKTEEMKKKFEDLLKKNANYEEMIKSYEKERIYLIEQQNQLKKDQLIFSQKKLQLDDKEKELNNKEQKIIKEENSLNEQKNNILKKQEELNITSQALSKRENLIIQKEKSLKEKEEELIQKNNELIESQRKFNEEKINKENQLKKKEESLIEFEASLQQIKLTLNKEQKILEEEKLKFEKSKLPIEIGLQNIGATCYMNATLQSLSNTDKFTEYFLTKYKVDLNDNEKIMSNEMYKVLFNLWDEDKKKGDYAPSDFKKVLSEQNPLFEGIQANDSKDLINFLLERFHQEMNEAKPDNNNINLLDNVNQMNEMETLKAFFQEYFSANKSIITDCFYGIAETKSICQGCKCCKYNFQIYSFLEFPLKEVNTYMFNMGRRYALVNQDGTNPDINIYECFEYYQKPDLMNGQNQMYCNICNDNRDTIYGTSIYSLPNYLVINLNRGKGAIYKCNVFFPEVLNVLNYVTNKNGITAMKLYAVICHYGPSSMAGHFIAYCKNRINKKWYKYNDSMVTECTQPNEYYNGMPYILFYQAV